MKDFLPLPFDLPAIKVTRNGKYSYLTTYLSIWEPAVLDENGNVIKKGRARTTNRKTVGKLLSEGLSGLVKFSTEFLIEHPQLVGLTIYTLILSLLDQYLTIFSIQLNINIKLQYI